MREPKLKRCPKCGGAGTPVCKTIGGLDLHYVECDGCGAQTYFFSTLREARRAWNAGKTRLTAREMREMIERGGTS